MTPGHIKNIFKTLLFFEECSSLHGPPGII